MVIEDYLECILLLRGVATRGASDLLVYVALVRWARFLERSAA